MPYLIDGHNVIAALPDIDLTEEHDEAKLVLKLRAWAGRERRKAIVVFDGGIPGGYAPALSTPDIQVVFAARFHTNADRVIRARLRKLRDAGNWTVVSSDREVLAGAEDVGARTLTAQEFAERLNQLPDAWKEKPDAISAAEVADWLAVFPEPTDLPPASPLPEPPPASPVPPRPIRDAPGKRRPVVPPPPTGKTSVPIGEQVGHPVAPLTPTPRGEKPDDISEGEVAEWLTLFGGDIEANPPPPRPRRPAAPPTPSPVSLTVDKELPEGLPPEEVAEWLALFGGDAEANPPPTAVKPHPDSRVAGRERRATQRWTKHKHRLAPTGEPPAGPGPSAEDVALWRRMYGDED